MTFMLTNPIMLKISASHNPVALPCGTLHLLVFLLLHQLSSLFSSLGLPHVGDTDIGKQLWFHYLLFSTDTLHPRWAHLASWLEMLPNVDSQTRFLTLSSPQCSRFAHSTTCCLANCLTSIRCAHSRASHPLSVPSGLPSLNPAPPLSQQLKPKCYVPSFSPAFPSSSKKKFLNKDFAP